MEGYRVIPGCQAHQRGPRFSLYTLEDMQFLCEYPTGRPMKQFPEQVGFDEDCCVLVGGSDHGTIYVFDRKTGLVLRLTVGSNVKPKCGNNLSESLHVFLLF